MSFETRQRHRWGSNPIRNCILSTTLTVYHKVSANYWWITQNQKLRSVIELSNHSLQVWIPKFNSATFFVINWIQKHESRLKDSADGLTRLTPCLNFQSVTTTATVSRSTKVLSKIHYIKLSRRNEFFVRIAHIRNYCSCFLLSNDHSKFSNIVPCSMLMSLILL